LTAISEETAYFSNIFKNDDRSLDPKEVPSLKPLSFPVSGRRGSNPPPPAWKAGALPNELLPLIQFVNWRVFEFLKSLYNSLILQFLSWGKVDSNHRSRRQQIYSLSHLATLVLPQHYPTIPFLKRAEEGARTPDLLITNQLLYQLSYFGLFYYDLKEQF
jgi:hypothetical protein